MLIEASVTTSDAACASKGAAPKGCRGASAASALWLLDNASGQHCLRRHALNPRGGAATRPMRRFC